MTETFPYSGNPPAQSHSPTSVAAAEKAKKSVGPSHRCILRMLGAAHHWGATDEEMQNGLAMSANTQRPRRCELVEMGRIKDSGKTRRTRSGREAVVWILAT